MSSIAFYYCFTELDLDYKWLSSQSRAIDFSNNGFSWVEWDKNVSGIIGSGTSNARSRRISAARSASEGRCNW